MKRKRPSDAVAPALPRSVADEARRQLFAAARVVGEVVRARELRRFAPRPAEADVPAASAVDRE